MITIVIFFLATFGVVGWSALLVFAALVALLVTLVGVFGPDLYGWRKRRRE